MCGECSAGRRAESTDPLESLGRVPDGNEGSSGWACTVARHMVVRNHRRQKDSQETLKEDCSEGGKKREGERKQGRRASKRRYYFIDTHVSK